MSVTGLYEELLSAVAMEGDRAAIRVRATYEPAGGAGSRVFPPTFPTERGEPPYVIEQRLVDGHARRDVVLDSVPSQANRAEEALLRARHEGRIALPLLELSHGGADGVTLTSLQWPHRYADAYLRDSLLDGVRFDKTELGQAFARASLEDASALYRHDPGSLVFGAWNSHRKGRQAKFPRLYSSELIGWDPELGDRRAGRMDPLNLVGAAQHANDDWTFAPTAEKVKGEKLSEIGHGNIAPNRAHGGVTISSAERQAFISLAGVDRIGFGGVDREAARAARAALVSYALLADRLAFARPSVWLRSGCDLVTVDDSLSWINRGGALEPFSLTSADAGELFAHAIAAADKAGLGMSAETIRLAPTPALADAIDFALTKAETTEG